MRPNVALGLMEQYPFKAESIDLQDGDSLLLYTDGVTEAKNMRKEYFGEERLLSTLSSSTADYLHAALNDVEKFVGKAEQSDDITLLQISKKA